MSGYRYSRVRLILHLQLHTSGDQEVTKAHPESFLKSGTITSKVLIASLSLCLIQLLRIKHLGQDERPDNVPHNTLLLLIKLRLCEVRKTIDANFMEQCAPAFEGIEPLATFTTSRGRDHSAFLMWPSWGILQFRLVLTATRDQAVWISISFDLESIACNVSSKFSGGSILLTKALAPAARAV